MRDETRTLDKSHARDLLYYCWCNQQSLDRGLFKLIENSSRPGETALETVSRVAEVKTDDITPFNHEAVRRRISDTLFREELSAARLQRL